MSYANSSRDAVIPAKAGTRPSIGRYSPGNSRAERSSIRRVAGSFALLYFGQVPAFAGMTNSGGIPRFSKVRA